MYIARPLKDYLDDLGKRTPAPGGGSVAALSAALGVGLLLMVANYTVGNKRYKDVEEEVAEAAVKIERFMAELKGLIDADIQAYERLSKGLKEKKKDSSALDVLYKDAIEPPFQICKIANECMNLCNRICDIGNTNLITDTAIAALMLESAFLSAKFNIYINLKYISDMNFIEGVHKVIAPLEKGIIKAKEDIIEKCEDVISG